MEDLIKKVEGILDQYFRDCVGNRVNQFSMKTLKGTILSEIANYKVDKKLEAGKPCKPVINNIGKVIKK